MRRRSVSLSGWGRCPVEACDLYRPASVGAMREALASPPFASAIPRGLGRSYGDSALNRGGGVVSTRELNRMLGFDGATGLLHAEAGVSVGDVLECLLPRGWFVATTPGTKFVTIGGAIAADVHGKNHHRDGSFGDHVRRIELLLPDGSVRWCGPDEDAELFAATIGGMGLTGVILSAELQLARAPSAWCDVTYRRTRDLCEALSVLESTDAGYRYSVAWVDTLAGGAGLGRSVVMLGNDAQPEALAGERRGRPFALPKRRATSVPFDMPSWLIGPWSVRLFNRYYYGRNEDRRELVDYESFFYPLDAIRGWNRMYGGRGFVQYQALVPAETARTSLSLLLEKVAEAKAASFLSVLKKAGPPGRGMLSFMRPGYTLAMDLANTGEPLRRLTRELDAILLKYGGRLYLAKDAMTDAETFGAMYGELDRFRAVKNRADPSCRLSSSQARRVGLVEPA